MWPGKFDYVKASSVEEVIDILSQNDDAKIIAGGHSLLPAMKLRLSQPSMLVDVSGISGLSGISANGSLKIGAMSTHAEIASSSDVQGYCAPLAQAAGQIGDQQVRNFGTLGGNVAHADPASDPPTVLTACGATIHLQSSSGSRSVSAEDFFIDLFTTDLGLNEIVTAVEVPNHSGKKSAYAKMPHPASRYAVVGVCVVLDMDGSTCSSASVAVGGAVVKPVRSTAAESALAGKTLDDATIDAAAQALVNGLDDDMLMDDITYPAEYRKQMAGVYLKRAIKSALG